MLNHQYERENHGCGTSHCSTDEHGLGSCLKGVAGAVVGLKIVFGFLKIGGEAKLTLDVGLSLFDVVLDE